MSRLLVLGNGPLPAAASARTTFPGLRTWHFAEGLARAGHRVTLVVLGEEAPPPPGEGPAGVEELLPLGGDPLMALPRLREVARRVAPQAWVTAGQFEPTRLATALVGDEPWWVDVPGDPFAEAQARASRGASSGEDPTLAHGATFLGALARGDAFSTCSRRQSLALLGQLGLAGRHADGDLGRRWVDPIPPCYGFGRLPEGAPRQRAAESPMVVALTGSSNTWFDGEGALRALLKAMDRLPGLDALVTGGGVPGHFTEGHLAFQDGALGSRHSRRFTFTGWVPFSELPAVLARAHLLLNMDRPGLEPLLGSRTRVIFAIHQGLRVASTPATELVEGLSRRGLVVETGRDPEDVAGTLERLYRSGWSGEQVTEAQAWLRREHDPSGLLEPVVRWAAEPRRAPAGLPVLSRLGAENATLRADLEQIHRSLTWRTMGPLHRSLLRLIRRQGP